MTEGPLRVLGCAAAALVLSVAPGVRAEERGTATDPAAASAAAAPQGPRALVIVADPAGTETENAELRAALNAVARAHGYDLTTKVDVAAIASRDSLVTAGTIDADPASMEQLRGALGVAALVRVSRVEDREAGTVRITVVTVERTQARLMPSAQ